MTNAIESQTPTGQEAETPTLDTGSDDEAINALMKSEPEADEATETPADETEDGADAEPDNGETDEADEPAEKLAEVEYEGKTYQVPPGLEKAVLRQADYSRKMNEVGAKEKEYTQRIETADKLIEGAESYAKSLAELSILDAQIKEFEGVDFDQLESTDPGKASLLALKLMRLQNARDKTERNSKQIDAEINASRSQQVAAKREAMLKTLAKDVPNWGDELGTKITQYAVSSGYSIDEISAVTDPKWVVAMDKARKFDAIQDGKKDAKSKAKDAPPVAKPGAKRASVNAAADSMARLRQTNSTEDAERALLARMK